MLDCLRVLPALRSSGRYDQAFAQMCQCAAQKCGSVSLKQAGTEEVRKEGNRMCSRWEGRPGKGGGEGIGRAMRGGQEAEATPHRLAFAKGAVSGAGEQKAASATWQPEPAANSWPAGQPRARLQLGLASSRPGAL